MAQRIIAKKTGQIDLFTKRVSKPAAPIEFHLHCQVADTLRDWRSPNWQYNHIASGEYRRPATAARLKRMGVQAGWPDFILISPRGQVHFLELKRAGEKLTEAQDQFFTWCSMCAIPCEWTSDFKTAVEILQRWGAVQTRIKP